MTSETVFFLNVFGLVWTLVKTYMHTLTNKRLNFKDKNNDMDEVFLSGGSCENEGDVFCCF